MLEKREAKKAVKEIKRLKLQKEMLEKQIAELEKVLKDEMTERHIDEMIIDEFKVKYTEVISNKFDTASFKKECVDLYQRYLHPATYMRFTIA